MTTHEDPQRPPSSSYPEHVVPHGGAPEVDVEVRVAALHSHQAVLLHEGLGEERVVRPVVLHPGHLLGHVRDHHQLRHPGGDERGALLVHRRGPRNRSMLSPCGGTYGYIIEVITAAEEGGR